MVLCEYVWLDADNGFRSKTRILDKVDDISDVPAWNYDGSSTGQSLVLLTEVILKPVAIFKDPFRNSGYSRIIWCEAHSSDMVYPASREEAIKSFKKNTDSEPWFGIEQEYYLTQIGNDDLPIPYGMSTISAAINQKQYPYYCKTNYNYGRSIAEEHLLKCIEAGIKMSGMNAEVGPSQWEYQVGPCTGIEAGDQLMISRYILERVAEKYNVIVDWSPKPFQGDWNGSGCHTNFSTKMMRRGDQENDGMTYIMSSILNLKQTHNEDVKNMGLNNNLRLTGLHETASVDEVTWGEGTRDTSIRIGTET